MSSILLISSSPIHQRMAGPGIRYWELSRHLSERHAVVLLTPEETDLSSTKFQIFKITRKTLKRWLYWADVIITQGYKFPLDPIFLSRKPLVIDLYDPLPIEILEHHRHLPLSKASLSLAYCLVRTQMLLQRGDFFICSHERQRDFWIGMLAASRRLNHELYRKDPELKNLIQLVPYGLPSEKPVHTRQVLKGVRKGISSDDKVILWGGGLWKWFDPCSVIKAIQKICQARQDIKLVFMGKTEEDPVARSTGEAVQLSQELGLYNKYVFFNEQWVPYQERQDYLLEADMGISTHFGGLESRFSFRTRILDYIWCELPIIATKGDFWSDLIEKEGLGILVDPETPDQITAAVLEMVDCPEKIACYKNNLRRVAGSFSWPIILRPLDTFCSNPELKHTSNTFFKMVNLINFYLRTMRIIIKHGGYKKALDALKYN